VFIDQHRINGSPTTELPAMNCTWCSGIDRAGLLARSAEITNWGVELSIYGAAGLAQISTL